MGSAVATAAVRRFSPLLLELVEAGWLIASVHHGAGSVRSAHLLEALLTSERFGGSGLAGVFADVPVEKLRHELEELAAESDEASVASSDRREARSGAGDDALARYTTNLTERARAGEIDPIFGRDKEIRQVIDILSRRRKNNAILVGEAGVGKTAVVEGLAVRLAEGDVPDSLRDTDILGLDLGLLQAGAGVKGEFENRLKSVLQAVREAPKPTLLFIDEAHTLIGAGGAAGTGDAANLLKPALARGELRTIAATTWSEFKKHIEKDPALERRFQPVFIAEPTPEGAAVMLRGLRTRYEDHHGVPVSAAAVEAMAHLSDRYISGRQLPDKAVDLMDTAAARVRMSQQAKPADLDDVERQLQNLAIERASVERDLEAGLRHDGERLETLHKAEKEAEEKKDALEKRWEKERALAEKIAALRLQLAGEPSANGKAKKKSTKSSTALRTEVRKLQQELAALQGEAPLVHAEVDESIVARVIADWTGIPAGRVLKDEATRLLELDDHLGGRIRGQAEAVGEVSDAIRAAKAGLGDPDSPLAVFLFVGPSGVGKTEMARALADELFGGERFLTTINMSEYQESHTVSQLKGSPPGYVGYGEGGVLTEAVRQRPYSVVLLDEAEKAHGDAMELFYQVFDKGMMRDGEGREISFRNTILVLTSNVASELFLDVCTEDERPTPDQLRQAIHRPLVSHFQAALLARMRVVPFYPLRQEALKGIARIKLDRLGERLESVHGTRFVVPDEVVDRITARCAQTDAGARDLDVLIDRHVLPGASRALLGAMAEGEAPPALTLGIDKDGAFTYTIDEAPSEAPKKTRKKPPAKKSAPKKTSGARSRSTKKASATESKKKS